VNESKTLQGPVAHYGDAFAEHAALRDSVGVLDLSFRSRLCLTGADRKRFLHGQVTNDVNKLNVGEGCYAALVTAKGKLQSDLNIYCLENELLLDFESGLSQSVAERFEKYIIADDVQVVDVSVQYGLVSVQGPKAPEVTLKVIGASLPEKPYQFTVQTRDGGEWYCMNHARGTAAGFELFVPTVAVTSVFEDAQRAGARPCGQEGLEMIRIEAGIPRFGVDMDETNLAPEVGIDARAISYTKGCYIGQEVISRIRTYGQVTKALRGLKVSGPARRGDKLFSDGKEVGYITSALSSPTFQTNIALGYVRREHNAIGTQLKTESEDKIATIVALPFNIADLKT
jgi:folate-binding protein YgfZ